MASQFTAAPAVPSLEVRRTIRASRQRVFDAWTKVEELKAWHAPGPAVVSFAEIDLREGGAYRIHMRGPGNATEVVLTRAIAHDSEGGSDEQGWTSIMDKLEAAYSGG